MRLKEWNWNEERYDEVEYPDKIIKEFVEYFRLNKQWRENPEVVFARWLKLERDLTDVRNEQQDLRCSATTGSGERCKRTATVGSVCEGHAELVAA